MPCSDPYFLEVRARLSLKVATKGCMKGKNNSENLDFYVVFIKQNGGVRPKALK